MIGQVGDDMFADSCLEMLNKAGVNTEHVLRSKNDTTAIAVIMVDSQGRSRIFVYYFYLTFR